MESSYEALLLVSFGGPDGMDDVMPFLANVLRGKNVPPQRMLEVAKHYEMFQGVSPINAQNRAIIKKLETELKKRQIALPIYFGNRNWHPLLADTIKQMKKDGVHKALALFTSAYSSYSGCRQYQEDIYKAREEVDALDMQLDKIRAFFNHPNYIAANVGNIQTEMKAFSEDILKKNETEEESGPIQLCFTAHSLPLSMVQTCQYEAQLKETCKLVASGLGIENYDLVYQSRSGPPSQPWLGPDILEHLVSLAATGIKNVLVHPIGFISEHMEVKYDLDYEAAKRARELNLNLRRSKTADSHPLFIEMLADLIEERLYDRKPLVIGSLPACPNKCPADCCL